LGTHAAASKASLSENAELATQSAPTVNDNMKYKVIIALILSLACTVIAQTMPPSVFFVANEGQWEEPFAFKYSNGGATWYVTQSGMTMDFRQYDSSPLNPPTKWRETDPFPPLRGGNTKGESVRGHVLKMNFLNANPNPQLYGEDKLASYSNYFIGRDPCKWRSFVGHYLRVLVPDVWPGIDVEYQVQSEGVETFYHVKPGADVNKILIEYEGLDAPLSTDSQGNLVLKTSLGEVKEKAPFAYQNNGNKQTHVPIRFRLLGSNKYALVSESYDAGKELLIDPLIYSTYFGAGYGIMDMSRDTVRNLEITGVTTSDQFPITPGAYQAVNYGQGDAFVSKLTPDGHQLMFSTYLGGIGTDVAKCLFVIGDGSVYAGGSTRSTDWPLSENAFDSTLVGSIEGFVCRLSSDGTALEYSSYIGGAGNDVVYDVAQDVQSGEIYMCGESHSPTTGFPITTDALFPETVGMPSFVSIFDPASSTLAYSTFFPSLVLGFGPSATTVVPIGNRQVWLSGVVRGSSIPVTDDAFQEYGGGDYDGFFAHLDFLGHRLVYSSYIGGQDREDICKVLPISENHVILAGQTMSSDFPHLAEGFDTSFSVMDGYITIMDESGALVHSTFLGGPEWDYVAGIVINSAEEVYAFGGAGLDFPTTPDAIDTIYDSSGDGFVCKLSADLSRLEYSTLLGGTGDESIYCCLLDGEDSVWVAGYTTSSYFPVTPDAFQYNLPGWDSNFLTHFSFGPTSTADRTRALPTSVSLSVYPNPFNSTANILFTLSARSYVTLRVFDVLGRVVQTERTGWMSAGDHMKEFYGTGLSSGIYLVQVESPSQRKTAKLILLK
jgi:hypothetical protein